MWRADENFIVEKLDEICSFLKREVKKSKRDELVGSYETAKVLLKRFT